MAYTLDTEVDHQQLSIGLLDSLDLLVDIRRVHLLLDLFPLGVNLVCPVLLTYHLVVTCLTIQLLIQTQVYSAPSTPASTNWGNLSILDIHVGVVVHAALLAVIILCITIPLLTDGAVVLAADILEPDFPFGWSCIFVNREWVAIAYEGQVRLLYVQLRYFGLH